MVALEANVTDKWPFEIGDEVEFTQDVDPGLPPECWDLCPHVRAGTRGTVADVRHDSIYVSLDLKGLRGAGIRLYRGGDRPLLISNDEPVIKVV